MASKMQSLGATKTSRFRKRIATAGAHADTSNILAPSANSELHESAVEKSERGATVRLRDNLVVETMPRKD